MKIAQVVQFRFLKSDFFLLNKVVKLVSGESITTRTNPSSFNKQGQGNQWRTPGVNFFLINSNKWGKWDETVRNRK